MALGTITVLDGNGSPILVQVLTVGAANTWAHVIVDGTAGSNVAQVTGSGALKVDNSGVIQPISGSISISGAVTIGAGSSMSIVQGGNTATVTAASALKVDNSAVTQPVSVSGTVGVTGTVTANIGTSGALALEGGGNLASLVAMYLAQGAALGANKQLLVGASVTTVPPTYTTGQINPLSLTPAGGLRIDGSGTTQPISGTVAVSSISGSVTTSGAVSITQGGNTAAVKAGSAVPVAADPALVVAISPNSQNPNGQTTAANSSPVVLASNQSSIPAISGGNAYKNVGASATATVLGTTGAVGDYLEGLLCVVATAATSQVQITDGSGSAFTVLPNAVGPGVGSYYVPIGAKSTSGAWKVTTAAGVSIIATGTFT